MKPKILGGSVVVALGLSGFAYQKVQAQEFDTYVSTSTADSLGLSYDKMAQILKRSHPLLPSQPIFVK